MKNMAAVVLAGGKGTRMQSETPKVLHQIGGEPMIYRTLAKLTQMDFGQIYVVVSYRAEEVKAAISQKFIVQFALQETPLGTGDALKAALKVLDPSFEHLLVVNGDDSSFYQPDTLQKFIQSHLETKAAVSLLTLELETESKLGRVIRDFEGNYDQILEAKEYFASGLTSLEINCGAYLFDRAWVDQAIEQVPLSQSGEYYITQLPNIAKNEGKKVNLFPIKNSQEWVGVNTQEELAQANQVLKQL